MTIQQNYHDWLEQEAENETREKRQEQAERFLPAEYLCKMKGNAMDKLKPYIENYEVKIGPHVGNRSGYFCSISLQSLGIECDQCGEVSCTWDESGHGETIEEAIDDAIRLVEEIQSAT